MIGNMNPWLREADGTIIENSHRVKLEEQLVNDVHIITMNGLARNLLDADWGAGVDIASVGELDGWVADYRHSEFWCRPAFGKALSEVPDETQGLIYRLQDGTWGVILPIVSELYKCVLKGTDQGVTARIFSWYERLNRCHAPVLAWKEGSNPYQLLEDCAAAALKVLNNGCKIRKERRYPEIFEYLGWCSWDSMQIRVNEAGLLQKCQEFKDKEIPVRWSILDDMWAEVHDFYDAGYDDFSEMVQLMHSSKLYSFDADPKRFPNGLKGCIGKMKDMGMTVGVWHPTTGYWYGIDPEGPVYREYKDILFQAESGHYIHGYETLPAYAFYNGFHTFLKECGADFLKIDNQSMIRRYYKGCAPVGQIARNVHTAMESSVGAHFDNALINCMGMASEDMWNRPASAVSRCSDDFLPENRAWFTKHILQCSYNSMVQGQFFWCDWDMWWTDDGQAVKNSVLRAISGGPIYVSDQLERSHKHVLDPLVLSDGKILRCDRPAMPTMDSIIENPEYSGKLFKLQNICGEGGVIAAFNLDAADGAVSGTISASDIDGLGGDRHAVYEYFSGDFFILENGESRELTLASQDEYKLYIIVPLVDGFAPIGLIDKMIAPKTIACRIGEQVKLYEGGRYAYVTKDVLKVEKI